MLFFQQKMSLLFFVCRSRSLSPFFSLSFAGLLPTLSFALSFSCSTFQIFWHNNWSKLNTLDNTDTETISAFRFRLYRLFSCLYFTGRRWLINNLDLHLGYLTCWDWGGQFYSNILSIRRLDLTPLFTGMRERSILKTEDFFFLFVKSAPVFLVKFEHPPPDEVQSLRVKFESLGDVLLRQRMNDDTFWGERMPGMSTCKIRKYGLVYTLSQVAQT